MSLNSRVFKTAIRLFGPRSKYRDVIKVKQADSFPATEFTYDDLEEYALSDDLLYKLDEAFEDGDYGADIEWPDVICISCGTGDYASNFYIVQDDSSFFVISRDADLEYFGDESGIIDYMENTLKDLIDEDYQYMDLSDIVDISE